MSESTNEDCGAGRSSVAENSNGQRSQLEEVLAEWRSSDQVENGTPSTSPPYWDIDDDDDDFGMCLQCLLCTKQAESPHSSKCLIFLYS